MSSVADYVGRRVDLCAYQGPTAVGTATLEQSLADPNGLGTVCTGVQILVQRFIIELFTRRGSVQYQPTRGTTFMTQLKLGYLRTEAEVATAFSEAIRDVYATLKTYETATDPTDEIFKSAELLAVAINDNTVSLSIGITSEAGSSRRVILPIPTMNGTVYGSNG